MSGVLPAILADLAAPTPPEAIKQRRATRKDGSTIIRNGQPLLLDYIDARYVMDTLDRVVGPANWQSIFEDAGPGAARCRLGIRVEEDWVWKSDVGTASNFEPEKGAHSDALKRAAVHWGIARDLYDSREADLDPVPAQQSQRPPVAQQYAPQPQMQTAGQPAQAPWACPVHGQFKVVPGGISKKTNQSYNAFFGCPVPNCNQTARGIPVPANLIPQPQVQQQAFDNSSNYTDPNGQGLPF
jgi:hypothetical protein